MSVNRVTDTADDVMHGATLSDEHGWLCIRNNTGWLLWSKKLVEFPAHGLSLHTVLVEARRNVEQKMPANPRDEE